MKLLVVAVAILAVLVSGATRGMPGAIGMLLGLFGTGFSIFGTWMGVRLMGGQVAAGQADGAARWMALAFLIKLPIVVGLGFLAFRLGDAGRTCFLWGLGLVYSLLFVWGITQK